jgi:antitoxin (DNA-binding transcriptional repressor) of toxin-antitoxin stability system
MKKKKKVTIHEAKTHLSKLIKEALMGVEITIANGKKPLVRLVVIEDEAEDPAFRLLGIFDNKMRVPEDFDALCEDLKDYQ